MIRDAFKDIAGRALPPFLEPILDRGTAALPARLKRLITRNDDDPYFYRYYLTGEEKKEDTHNYGVFLHKFVGDDPLEEVHCHPWKWCFAIILVRGYREIRWKRRSEVRDESGKIVSVTLEERQERVLLPFEMNLIEHDDMHRVHLLDGPSWSLFVHGPRISTWGFANEVTGKYREITIRTVDKPPVTK